LNDDSYDETDPLPDTEAEVSCPYCGETVTIILDPGSGTRQEYVEDCEVCCRPWRVRVRYDGSGVATVTLDPAQ
jgi:Cysteine-rich CPXCG